MEKHAFQIAGILWLINSNVTDSFITALLSCIAGLTCFVIAIITSYQEEL